MQWLAYILVALVFSLLPLTAKAGEPGLRLYNQELDQYTESPGIASDIHTQINGNLARTNVVQYFFNHTDQWQEGVYTHPLPQDASVDKLVMIVGEKRILGFVAQKDKARKIYETAKNEGKASGLVEQHRPNLFRTSVANIPPQSLVAIEIAYQHGIKIDGREFSMRLPLAVTPRYDQFTADDFLQLASNEASETQMAELAERISLFDFDDGNNPARLNIKLSGGAAIQDLKSTSHKVDVKKTSDKSFEVSTKNRILEGEQDFVLEWSLPETKDPVSFMHQEEIDGYYYAHLVVIPPEDGVINYNPKRQVTLILDTSGSMQGPSIRQAKSAIREALHDLNDNDLFNVIHFNSYTDSLFGDSKPASVDNIKKALRWVNSLSADGGTVMFPALKAAFDERPRKEYLRQIVFVTDGAIGYGSDLGGYIKEHITNERFFAVGIGAAPNADLMETVARQGRGTFTFISDVAQTKAQMGALFAKMKSPALTDIRLILGDENADVVPGNLPDLLSGEPLSVAIKSSKPLDTIGLEALKGGRVWSDLVQISSHDNAEGIGKVYAARKIQDIRLSDPYGNDALKTAAMTDLAIEHQIVSAYTSLVAVDEKRIRPENAPISTKRYHPNLPKGWQLAEYDPRDVARDYFDLKQNGTAMEELKKDINLPQTDTGYVIQLLMGMIMVLLSIMLMMRMNVRIWN